MFWSSVGMICALLAGPAAPAQQGTAQAPKARACAGVPSVAPERIHKIGGEIKSPYQIRRSDPQMPAGARCRGLVLLRVVIDEQGRVASATDLSKDPDAFTQAYVEASCEWRFRPATRKDEPVAVEVYYTVNIKCN